MKINLFLDGKNNKNKQYQILEKIGSGGFGEVYKANDQSNNRYVAIKIFQRQIGDTNGVVTDWEREAQHALSLKDNHIIEAYEFVQSTLDDGTDVSYLVMEHADNGSLYMLIERQKRNNEFLTEAALIDIFRQTLLGLQSVHKTALHRDIKPENMLFVADTLKLSDFGLAKHIDEVTRTRTYKGWGTYKYMAPESWILGKMTLATDIYSLGIVWYELVTLKLPFSSADVRELEDLHKYGDRSRTKATNPNISSKLDGIIYKMMMHSPSSRYQSVDEILQEIDKTPITSVPHALAHAASLAQQLHIKKTQEETARQKRLEQAHEREKKNQVKVKEFVSILEEIVEGFNQVAPESKLALSQGHTYNYTLLWQDTDLLRFTINPHIGVIKLKGNAITSYVEVVFRVPSRPNEGTCFILCINEKDESDYGDWKVLENTYHPLMSSSPGVYPLSAELSQLKNLQRQGGGMGQFEFSIRDNVKEELANIIKKAFEYYNQAEKMS